MKQLKKITVTLIIMIATIMVASIGNASYAGYLAAKGERREGDVYQALNKTVWKIYHSNSMGGVSNYDSTIYCLRGGVGFGSSSFGSGDPTAVDYTKELDMKNRGSITGNYASAISGISDYDALLWLLKNIYIPPVGVSDSDREAALELYKQSLYNDVDLTYMTEDDIDAVQQLAIWHFTNPDSSYDVDYVSDGAGTFEFNLNGHALSDYREGNDLGLPDLYGWDRAEECTAYYDYLVTEAVANRGNALAAASQPYELNQNLTITQQTNGNNFIIGPFQIKRLSKAPSTLTETVKIGDRIITNPTLQDASGNSFSSIQKTIALGSNVGTEFYVVVPNTTTEEVSVSISGTYDTIVTYLSVESNTENNQPVVEIKRGNDPYSSNRNFTPTPTPTDRFDLALRKFIIKAGDTELKNASGKYIREPQISTLADLAAGRIDTAVKTHIKTPVSVEKGEKVTYIIRVYNEGNIDGYVKEITDYLPEGLKLAENSTTNTNYGWTNPSGDGRTIVTDKLAGTLLKAFDGTKLESLDVQIECEVTLTAPQTGKATLKNIAEITAHSDKLEDTTGDTTIRDDDSTPKDLTDSQKNNYNPGTSTQGWGYEDDDDYEELELSGKRFDLALRKFIIKVENTELKDLNGKYIREPKVDVTPLLSRGKTAIYNHPKTPVSVDVGDTVIYTIRVYNEGQVDGYVKEITDHLPKYLEFVNDEFNAKYGWKVSSDGRTVTTDITSPNTTNSANRDLIYADRTDKTDKVLLKAFDTESSNKTLDYIDVQIACKVKETNIAEKITNIAEITSSSDSEGAGLTDIDNKVLVTLPNDEVLPEYKDDEINRGEQYIEGQEDDDDFEKVIVQKFDLSLRKFIIGVNNEEIQGRAPIFSIDSDGKMKYEHPKTPVEVVNGDTVIYTIRIYNEGNQAGYAEEVKDDIPEGLEYLPDNDINKAYGWKLYKKDGETEVTEVSEAKVIKTDYLSKAQETATGRNNLIKAFDKQTMSIPDWKEVRVAFKVTEPNTSDRIIINTAEIAEDADEDGNPVKDIDSTPDNDEDGEDDIDTEKIKVKYFDLALDKIISEYSIKVSGKTTTTKTGHKFGVKPEPVVKIETLKKIRKSGVVKFKYQIQVTNEGEIEGYATEIKDYIPEGLKFVKSDNPKWELSEDGKTVTTNQLKDKLLKPGESAVVEITLQWINGDNNLGVKQNWAEISKDDNESDTPDIDSTPDNKDEEEDDIDDATVILSIQTGAGENYIILTTSVLAILASGVILIKKFVI